MFQPDELNAPTCSDHVIKSIIDNGAKILYNKYLNNKAPLYMSEDILSWNNGVML